MLSRPTGGAGRVRQAGTAPHSGAATSSSTTAGRFAQGLEPLETLSHMGQIGRSRRALLPRQLGSSRPCCRPATLGAGAPYVAFEVKSHVLRLRDRH